MTTKNEKIGRLLVWGNCLMLTFFYLGIDFIFRHWNVDAISMLFWGYVGAVVLCAPWFLTRTRQIKTELTERKWLLLSIIIISIISTVLWTSAMGAAGSGPVAIMENAQTLFAVGLGILFLKEKLTKIEILAGISILAGVILTGTIQGEVPLWAALATIIASFTFALQSFLIKKFGGDMNSGVFSYIRGIGVAIFFAGFAFFFDVLEPLPWIAILLIGVLYVLGAVVSRYFFFESHKYLPISQINLLILVIPVMVLLGTFLIFRDPISLQKIAGAILTICGAIFFVRERNRNAK